jgi:EAL domain-containing protein (putative c-di-GMP-specific phosphodiesterase class I)
MSLADPGFLNHAIDVMDKKNVAHRICFEITETAAITHLEDARHFMNMLGSMGCKFSLDDFGSGMSSFAYLKELPVHSLKISGEFVRNMTTNRHDYVFVSTMTKLAHDLGLKCVGEFVQDLETLNALRELNVDFAQGFYLHKPESICTHCRQLRYCTLPMSKNIKVVSLAAA